MEEMNELVERVLTEITKDELIMAIKIFEKMIPEERRNAAELVRKIDDSHS